MITAYGSFGCGLPSLVAPAFGSRLPAHSLSRPRILLHHGVDVSGAVFLNLLVHAERRPGRRFVSEVLKITGYNPDTDRYDFSKVFAREEGK